MLCPSIEKLGDNVNKADPMTNFLCGFAYFNRGSNKTILCCENGFYLIDTKDITKRSLRVIEKITGALI